MLTRFLNVRGRATEPAPGTPAEAMRRGASLWVLCAVLLAAVWAGIGATIASTHRAAASERAALAASTAKGFSEYVGLHVLIVDRILLNLRETYPRSGTVPAHEVLRLELGQMGPMLLQVSVADASGAMVASSLPLQPAVSIADRPHFQAFVGNPLDRLHFSQPVIGRVSKKMSLQLVRPLLGPGGELRGVLVASIDPLQLQQYFGSLDAFADGGAVTIVGRTDGVVRARFTGKDITWGQSMAGGAGWPSISVRRAGHLDMTGLDGVRRTFGYHQSADYPLAVLVSWPAPAWWELGPGLVTSCVVALAFSVLAVRQTWLLVRRDRESRRVIARLEAARAREDEANRMQASFLASVSHELRTPLNSILGFSELIGEVALDEDTRRYAGQIHRSGKHLHVLVNTMLDMARIDAGRMAVESEPVEVTGLIAALVDVHRVVADRKGLGMTVSFDLPPGSLLETRTDRTKFTQVVSNVLDNAVKFTVQGGVWITGLLEGDTLLLRVVDTGPGIAPQRLATVFDRFAGEGSADREGSGLGLPMSRELMHLLGGTITIHSDPGQGTQIEIRLPRVQRVAHNPPP